MDFELKKLKSVLLKYREVIDETKNTLDIMPLKYKYEPDMLEEMITKYTKKLNLLEKAINKPYFSRIDFKDEMQEVVDICYIGKVGLSEYDSIITVDWRSPIASLYYDSNIGSSSYTSPSGVINGELLLKRQFDIDASVLISFLDIDTVADDELLKPYLGVSADNRLKNIVSSIQSEQNAIIRKSLFKDIIVQGVAGSGKTTVALHRIAYLVYNNIDRIKPSQYMVIGPNKFFLNYISSVLPDLDVNNVSQLTLFELLCQFLQEDLILNPKNTYYDFDILFNQIDKFLFDFEKNIIPNDDFYIRNFRIMSKDKIRKVYDSVDKEKYFSIKERVNKTISILVKEIKLNTNKYLIELSSESFQMINSNVANDVVKKDLEYARKEVNSGCVVSLRKYFSKAFPNPITLYAAFLSNININSNNVAKRIINISDIAPLFYFKYRLSNTNLDSFRHVVIDEAQDLSKFDFFVLTNILKNSTFSIFGDIAQGIYGNQGIKSFSEIITYRDFEYDELVKSYRTTIEIMSAANNITEFLNLNSATPLIRHGKSVIISDLSVEKILEKIEEFNNSSYGSMAIICKNVNEVDYVYNELLKFNIITNKITDSNISYSAGICVITSHLSKGLEFDVVVIYDASEEVYDSTISTDMKLLYVAMTRALHELSIFYSSTITTPLLKILNN